VTSRETRRWIIPKGWPHKGRTPHRSAAREAYEEASVVGRVHRDQLGSFSYEKRLPTGDTIVCKVRVFALEVRQQRREWPEKRSQVDVSRAGRKNRQGTDAGEDHSTVRTRHHAVTSFHPRKPNGDATTCDMSLGYFPVNSRANTLMTLTQELMPPRGAPRDAK
jgi:ADP-ribose pyrophosphatase YjhB (NUDIX family)